MSALHLYSFHSIQGGVGKSTLAIATATQLARMHPTAHVVLVDTSLTGGSSLAEGLCLQSPRWTQDMPLLSLQQAPDGWHELDLTRALILRRAERQDPHAHDVPFLNDYLLYQPSDGSTDANPHSWLWLYRSDLPNLFVIPASPLPRDVAQIDALIRDDATSAFLEARLERLLTGLLPEDDAGEGDLFVVLDTPATLVGLSRTVISLVMRLSNPENVLPLAENQPSPAILESLDRRTGRALVVVLSEWPEHIATERWCCLSQDPRIEVVWNKCRRPNPRLWAMHRAHTVLHDSRYHPFETEDYVDHKNKDSIDLLPWLGTDPKDGP